MQYHLAKAELCKWLTKLSWIDKRLMVASHTEAKRLFLRSSN